MRTRKSRGYKLRKDFATEQPYASPIPALPCILKLPVASQNYPACKKQRIMKTERNEFQFTQLETNKLT